MTLEDFLIRTARTEAERPELEESLLGGRFLRYARYRLGGFAATRLAAVAVTLAEYGLLSRLVSVRSLLGALAVANACQLIASFWWGGLEVLRTRIRTQSKPAAQRELAAWLARALMLATVLFVLGGVGLIAVGPTVASAYGFVCVARLALDLVARTLYSGIYARARIYRPTVSLLAGELVGLAGVAAGQSLLGPWSFPLGLTAAALASRGLALVYTLRAYRMQRMPVPKPRPRREPDFRRVFVAGVANVALRVASLATLALLAAAARGDDDARGLGVRFHVIAPLLNAAGGWAQVFYLDLKRLESPAVAMLLTRFENQLVRLAFAIAPLLWLTATGASSWAGLPLAPPLAFTLLAVIAGQSVLSVIQLTHFVRGRFLRLVASGLAVTAGLMAAVASQGAARATLAAAGFIGGFVLLGAFKRAPPRPHAGRVRSATLVSPAAAQAWMVWLAQQPGIGNLQIRRARVAWIDSGPPRPDTELLIAAGGLLVELDRQPSQSVSPTKFRASADRTASENTIQPSGRVIDVACGSCPDVPPRRLQALWQRAVRRARGASDATDGVIRQLHL